MTGWPAYLRRYITVGLGAFRARMRRLGKHPAQPHKHPSPFKETIDRMRSTLSAAALPQETSPQRASYLDTAEGIVRAFIPWQAPEGRILDPVEREERQYSTPCFAAAAAILVAADRAPDLLDSACRALESTLSSLAENRPADLHGDFFCFYAIFAYETLRDRVSTERRERWERLFRSINPVLAYVDIYTFKRQILNNWNVISACGEYMRSQHGFTHTRFFEHYMGIQMDDFAPSGMYLDAYFWYHHHPMIYDHYTRYVLGVVLERGYQGRHREALEILLDRGMDLSLLLQSPCGELPTGGRTKQHQWGDAQQCVTFELWAKRRRGGGDEVMARAYKRAAHLALAAVQRWIRPEGDLWIVKNRQDPALRHGFEDYSFHSQYNLQSAAMLTLAWHLADESIPEGPCPADVGGFALPLPEVHKLIANAGGHYVELDTGAHPTWESTGLIRVHKAGFEPLIGPSDCSPADDFPLAVGIAWAEGSGWKSLAEHDQDAPVKTTIEVIEETPASIRFQVRYALPDSAAVAVIEKYTLTPERLQVTALVEGDVERIQVRFPALASDGERESRIEVDAATAIVALNGSVRRFEIVTPAACLQHIPARIPCRNGFFEQIVGDVPGREMTYALTFSHDQAAGVRLNVGSLPAQSR